MYQKQKIKTSLTLISDRKSIVQHLKRSDLQCFKWKQCMKQNMIIPKLERRDMLENNYLQVLLNTSEWLFCLKNSLFVKYLIILF